MHWVFFASSLETLFNLTIPFHADFKNIYHTFVVIIHFFSFIVDEKFSLLESEISKFFNIYTKSYLKIRVIQPNVSKF